MGAGASICSRAEDAKCGHCQFSCQCTACSTGDHCDCSCRWLVVGGLTLCLLSGWVAVLAWRERRRWLLTWAAIYAGAALVMTLVTYARGPDPHDAFGCSVPLSLWVGTLFVATLSYYTSDFMRSSGESPVKPEKFDPAVGEYVKQLSQYHVV